MHIMLYIDYHYIVTNRNSEGGNAIATVRPSVLYFHSILETE